jgi:hypothetical protein
MKRGFWAPLPALFLILTAAPILAQVPGPDAIPPEMIAALEAEKPLTQADVETYARILPVFTETGRQSPEAALKIVADAGFTEPRMALLFSRVSFALLMGGDPALDSLLEAQGIPRVLWPTAGDLALVRKNRAALEEAYQRSGLGGAVTP